MPLRQLFFTASLLLLTFTVRAELLIEITKGQGEAAPIAIVPFGWLGEGPAPPNPPPLLDMERAAERVQALF